MIVLDTDALIEIFDKRSVKGDEALRKLVERGEDIATTVINLHEILYGLEKYAKPVRDVVRAKLQAQTSHLFGYSKVYRRISLSRESTPNKLSRK
jgi:predicted nucleic acid-binding protein